VPLRYEGRARWCSGDLSVPCRVRYTAFLEKVQCRNLVAWGQLRGGGRMACPSLLLPQLVSCGGACQRRAGADAPYGPSIDRIHGAGRPRLAVPAATAQAALSEAGSAEIEAGQIQVLPDFEYTDSRDFNYRQRSTLPAPTQALEPCTRFGSEPYSPHLTQPCQVGTKAVFFYTVHGAFSFGKTKRKWGCISARHRRAKPCKHAVCTGKKF